MGFNDLSWNIGMSILVILAASVFFRYRLEKPKQSGENLTTQQPGGKRYQTSKPMITTVLA